MGTPPAEKCVLASWVSWSVGLLVELVQSAGRGVLALRPQPAIRSERAKICPSRCKSIWPPRLVPTSPQPPPRLAGWAIHASPLLNVPCQDVQSDFCMEH
jgi:hypothetical protein